MDSRRGPAAGAREDRRYPRSALVPGLEVGGAFKAYPFDELARATPRFTRRFGGHEFDVLYDRRNRAARILEDRGREVPMLIAFWFAWYAFHPDTAVFEAE